jgi:hypothetical protein
MVSTSTLRCRTFSSNKVSNGFLLLTLLPSPCTPLANDSEFIAPCCYIYSLFCSSFAQMPVMVLLQRHRQVAQSGGDVFGRRPLRHWSRSATCHANTLYLETLARLATNQSMILQYVLDGRLHEAEVFLPGCSHRASASGRAQTD